MGSDRGQMCGGHGIGVTIVIMMAIGLIVYDAVVHGIDPNSSFSPDTGVSWLVSFVTVIVAVEALCIGIGLGAWGLERLIRDPEDYNTTFRTMVVFAALYPPIRILVTVGLVRQASWLASFADHTVYRDGEIIVLCASENRKNSQA